MGRQRAAVIQLRSVIIYELMTEVQAVVWDSMFIESPKLTSFGVRKDVLGHFFFDAGKGFRCVCRRSDGTKSSIALEQATASA